MTISTLDLEINERRRSLDRQRAERDTTRSSILSFLSLTAAAMTFLGGAAVRHIPRDSRDTFFFALLLLGLVGFFVCLAVSANAVGRKRLSFSKPRFSAWLWQWEIHVVQPSAQAVADDPSVSEAILGQYVNSIESNGEGLARLGYHLLLIIAMGTLSISLWTALVIWKAV